jgi:hypothetical protein
MRARVKLLIIFYQRYQIVKPVNPGRRVDGKTSAAGRKKRYENMGFPLSRTKYRDPRCDLEYEV